MQSNYCRVERAERAAVKTLCTYEVVALHTALPTITSLNARHPVVGVGIVAALVWHFWRATVPSEPEVV